MQETEAKGSLHDLPGELRDATYRAVMDSLYDAVYFVDRDRRIHYWNQSAERLTGYTAERVVGCRCMDNLLSHVDEDGQPLCFGRCPLQASMDDGQLREANVYLRHKDGHREKVMVRTAPIRDADGEIVGGVEIFNTDERLLAAMSEVTDLKRDATRDPLTGLGNRRLMEEFLRARIAEMQRYEHPFSLLFVDIDHFKDFNDAWGHAAGDVALQTVAKTLEKSARAADQVTRWGGEEFVIALSHTGADAIEVPAERFRAMVQSSRVRWQDQDLEVTVSIGGTVARPDDSPEVILARADKALYRAKEEGRNRVVLDLE